MAFEGARFIKASRAFTPEYRTQDPAPLFRRRFVWDGRGPVTLEVCALGYGDCFLNGRPVTDDRFIASFGNYTRTLWYTVYDVTPLLCPGENIFAAVCGNGFYNETLPSAWDFDKAVWRDAPKLIARLYRDDESLLVTDSQWLCNSDSAIVFNQLRSGEHFDARKYDPSWNTLTCDDADWAPATEDENPPTGVFRRCECPPIREIRTDPALPVPNSLQTRTEPGADRAATRQVYDSQINRSGYIRLSGQGRPGQKITVRYAEQLNPDTTLQLNGMDAKHFYKQSAFQTDVYSCDGRPFVWSPRFVYHGFRYLELTTDGDLDALTAEAVEIHQDVATLSGFSCSNEDLNRLFTIGQRATLSNLFYMPTDCPTREKLGWCNDAAASAEQMLLDFDTAQLLKKWLIDLRDAQREDGALPGIVPTAGWGYEWGSGPISGAALFEIPYRIYEYTGDEKPLCESLSAFLRYLDFNRGKVDCDGLIGYGLCDWAGPFETLEAAPTPVQFSDSVLLIWFMRVTETAAELCGEKALHDRLQEEEKTFTARFCAKYLLADGRCKVDEQTAVALLIYYGIGNPAVLGPQLAKTVDKHDFHHDCGMLGLRRLYYALDQCGLSEYAYRIVTAKGYPSYDNWLKRGATTLCETWQEGNSQNHHMYSDFMHWLLATPVGIRPDVTAPGFKKAIIAPFFVSSLDRCAGWADTAAGRIAVEWQRDENDAVTLCVSIPSGCEAALTLTDYTLPDGQSSIPLPPGRHTLIAVKH